jgi:hypothetical protein
MTKDSAINLYKLLGITDNRFRDVITPAMNDLCHREATSDDALMSIEKNKDLQPHEKLYCSYAIGRICAIEEIKSKIPSPMRKLIRMG